MDTNAIELENVSKTFRVYHEKKDLAESLTHPFTKNKFHDLIVLQNTSFKVKKGEMFGIIGRNGTGKTTLLRLIAKIYKPDSGKIRTQGSLVSLLELGIGFNPEFTARSNIILYGKILGLSSREIKSKVKEILKFAELEEFADTKLKNFSTGMYARLAFSTAMQVDPDILLVDEILSVGDITFQQKSFEAFRSFKQNKKTIVYVSHNLDSIKELCDRALFLNNGKIECLGKPEEVIAEYIKSSS